MKVSNSELFKIVMNFLGWGDPENGLWFIGIEERMLFDEETILKYKGQKFVYVDKNKELNWPVAITTSKICAFLLDTDPANYRSQILWRKGSKVFNANLLPIGKSKIDNWPELYKKLFGFTYEGYIKNRKRIIEKRKENFKKFIKEMHLYKRNASPGYNMLWKMLLE